MEGEIPTWDLNDLLWELLPPEPTLSPYYFVFLLYIYIFLIIICYVLSFLSNSLDSRKTFPAQPKVGKDHLQS